MGLGQTLLAWYAATMFLGAGLLFLVEPMVAKMVLPLLGGTPAVWNTCMLWFQACLLAGYAYAHFAPRVLGRKLHVIVHLALLAMPFLVLPIEIRGWVPPGEDNPAFWLLGLLTVVAGLPFFLVATTGPLLQHWFAQTSHDAAQDPYFLYAASNVGSLGALLAYPFVVEPGLRIAQQTWFWTLGYAALVIFIGGCALMRWKWPNVPADRDEPQQPIRVAPGARFRWLAWAFIPSSLMLGVTTYLTTDIAPVPLLWVAPLALYLLTFILAFARPQGLDFQIALVLLPVGIAALILTGMQNIEFDLSIVQQILLHLAVFFIAARVCHGELARSRPDRAQLTEYYLIIAIGGALGGVCNAILAPLLFNRVLEYPLAIVLIGLMRPQLGADRPGSQRPTAAETSSEAFSDLGTLGWILFSIFAGVLFYFESYHGDWSPEALWHIERNFFGVVSVRRDPQVNCVNLLHGTTVHGVHSLDPAYAQETLGYFSQSGPIGQALRARTERRNVAIIGLGAGSLANYGQAGESWTFYEIDPAVVRIAENVDWFPFLRDARARGVRMETILGDARLQLEKSSQQYDVLIVDAFSSDSIPVHLLTRQALQVYLDHLRPGGWLAFHLSSEYLRLAPVIASQARAAGLTGLYQEDLDLSPADFRRGKLGSQWAILARSPDELAALAASGPWTRLIGSSADRVWTDDYSNIVSVIKKRSGPGMRSR